MAKRVVALLAGWLIISHLAPAYAEVVITQQTASTKVVNNLAINVSRNTGWMFSFNQASLALDVELTWSATADVRTTCETCRVVSGGVCQDAMTKTVDVIVSTDAATGQSTVRSSTWVRPVSASVGFTVVISNVYNVWTRCAFIGGAGVTVNDKVSVWQRFVTP